MAIEASAPEGGPPDRPATIYTVAEAAGVSHQTVSRYLKGDSLRPGNRERVEQAVRLIELRMAGADHPPEHLLSPVSLVERSSTRAPSRA